MAWLRLTKIDRREALINTDQVSEFTTYNGGTTIWASTFSTDVRNSLDEIAAMIADAERRDRVDSIFRAIVCNFPHGYDPLEIVDTARRLLDALDKPREI